MRQGFNKFNSDVCHQVDGVPMEVIRISLFLKQKLMVVMIDVSMACTVSKFYTDIPEQEAVSVCKWYGV